MLWGGDPIVISQPTRVERAMANYWLKHNSNSLAEGPYNASQLKAMAAAGQISPTALISNDREKWTPAPQVKGLFPAAPSMPPAQSQSRPQPPPPAMAPMPAPPEAPQIYDDGELPPSEPYELQSPDPPALPPPVVPQAVPVELGYAGAPRAPRGIGHTGQTGEVRDLKGYLVATIVVAAIFFAAQISSGQYHLVRTTTPAFQNDPSPLSTAGSCFGLMAWIALLIYGFVWVGRVHSEIFDFTGGEYRIKPAMAVGFCFIPFFNLYWIPAMMFGLASEIERYLGPGRISPVKVLVFQILAFVPGCCIGAISPIFFALAMLEIQKGLNELWTRYRLPAHRFRY